MIMKKYLIFMLLISVVSVKAQSYDEVDLIGKWYFISKPSSFPLGIKDFNGFYLGYTSLEGRKDEVSGYFIDLDKYPYNHNERILDFFISNNNKLHIIIGDDFCLRYVIEYLTESQMKLKAYDGSYSFIMGKDTSTTGVRSAIQNQPTDSTVYDLNGKKVENIKTNGIYIQSGQKKVIKK